MRKKLFLLAGILFFSVCLQAQHLTVVVDYVTTDGKGGTNSIAYQPDQPLTWNDFNGKPVAGSDAAALTSAGFGVKLMFRRLGEEAQLTISVSCSFSKKDSWVLPGNKTPYILNHEQKHFDIAYLNTLVFMQKLREAHFTNTNYASVIEKVYNESAQELSNIQNQYDAESSHSRIPAKQAVWDERISKQLLLAAKE